MQVNSHVARQLHNGCTITLRQRSAPSSCRRPLRPRLRCDAAAAAAASWQEAVRQQSWQSWQSTVRCSRQRRESASRPSSHTARTCGWVGSSGRVCELLRRRARARARSRDSTAHCKGAAHCKGFEMRSPRAPWSALGRNAGGSVLGSAMKSNVTSLPPVTSRVTSQHQSSAGPTMALLVTSLSLLAYQLTPLRPHGDARAPAPSMEETRLNNYVLPGPMTPLGNQVCKLSARPACTHCRCRPVPQSSCASRRARR